MCTWLVHGIIAKLGSGFLKKKGSGSPMTMRITSSLASLRYLVTHLMGADLNNIVKCQKLTDDHVQFLIYQILRGLKVTRLFPN